MSAGRLARAAAALLAMPVLAVAGCSHGGSHGGGQVTVFAAASLKDAFGAVATAYRRAHPGVSVTLSFAGSQDLVAQIGEGAPADVLATADTTTMDAVGARAGGARTFARNRLVIAVAKGNPHHVTGLASLADPHLVVVLAAPSVPAGKYAAEALATAHVQVYARSLEDNVRGVLTKVALGEADAGIVYATDAASARSAVDAVPIASSPVAAYPIVALTSAGRAFVDFVLSPAGQRLLRASGFLPP